ncbi:MAG: hypothetical protein ACFFG0_31780 [Candidatus Thorarchaeota archaeon]
MSKTYSIKKDFHTKKEIDIWILKLNRENRLTRENFLQLKSKVQDHNGYYSRYSKGFIFEFEPSKVILTDIDRAVEELLSQQEETRPEQVNYRPISEIANSQYNYYRMSKGDLNDDYETNLRNMEQKFKDANLDINSLPALIKEAFDRYQTALKEYYERKAKANIIYPNPYMTGRSNYKNIEGKKAKAHRTEQIGIEKVKYAEKKLKTAIKNYIMSQDLKTSKRLDFEKENLNHRIRNVRSKFRPYKLIIRKAFGGVRQKHKHATYYFQIHDKQFHLSIDEYGNYALLKFRGGEIYSRRFASVKTMMKELTTFLENLTAS